MILKGIFSGLGALAIAFVIGENIPAGLSVIYSMVLGFVSYGLSIFFYVKAQNVLGAAKTSAYYAAAPFIGALMSFIFLDEKLSLSYIAALVIMLAGSWLVVIDTLIQSHNHQHTHVFTYIQGGIKHTKIITHTHSHNHYINSEEHRHFHIKGRSEQ